MKKNVSGWMTALRPAILALGLFGLIRLVGAGPVSSTNPGEPPAAPRHADVSGIGWLHGGQYWLNPETTEETIDRDFRVMSTEDQINFVRIALWMWRDLDQPVPERAFRLVDACFKAGKKYGIKINPAFNQVNHYMDGGSDDPVLRNKWKRYIQQFVRRYKDEPALVYWSPDVENVRDSAAVWNKLSPVTEKRYEEWLRGKYPTLTDYIKAHPGATSYPSLKITKQNQKFTGVQPTCPESKFYTADWGLWNKFGLRNDWLTFNCFMNADLELFQAQAIREADPRHPISATPYDVLLNQPVRQGRNFWWIEDAVDIPSLQMETHWHLELADMPRDVLTAQAASIRKVYCASRERGVSLTGEFLAGPEYGEGARRYSPTGDEILMTDLTHLAEGSKGFLYWLLNPLLEGPNAGLWSLREIDGSPNERSRAAATFGRMVKTNNGLLFGMRPADSPVAIYDSMDGAIYLELRTRCDPASTWFAQNQYGFFKALRKSQVGCDFIDLRGLRNGKSKDYACIYVPFAMALSREEACLLRAYVAAGGTILCDCLTGFSEPNGVPYRTQPGAGMDEVLGLKTNPYEVLDSRADDLSIRDAAGRPSPLIALQMRQTVQPTSAQTLYADPKGRPLMTVNHFGKGHALWSGIMLGMGMVSADTPPERYQALADLIRPYLPRPEWRIEAPANTIVVRHLRGGEGDLFVLLNENRRDGAAFKLDPGRPGKARELLDPETPAWRQVDGRTCAGTLPPMQGRVIYLPAVAQASCLHVLN